MYNSNKNRKKVSCCKAEAKTQITKKRSINTKFAFRQHYSQKCLLDILCKLHSNKF